MATSTTLRLPACHIFAVGGNWYAYDVNTQHLVAVEAPLADLLRGGRAADPGVRRALRRAQREEGLFLAPETRLVPRSEAAATVDQDLRHLVLTVTEACNLRCTYCLHGANLAWVRAHGTRQMEKATALAATEYFLDRHDLIRPPLISFYGGEPLLNRAVIGAVVKAARAHSHGRDTVFMIDTNGVLLDSAMIEWVVRNGVHLQISLDGAAAQHDRYRVDSAGQPTYDRIVGNIGRLLDRDPGSARRLSYVVTLAPPVDLFAVSDFFAAFPLHTDRSITARPRLTVNFANLKGQAWGHDLETAAGLPPLRDQVAKARRMYVAALGEGRREELGPVVRALFEPELIRLHHRSRARLGSTFAPGGNCRPGRRKLHVTVDGHLQPCERTGAVVNLGTVGTGIQAQAVTEVYERFHRAVQERCGRCWALRLCSVCFAAQAEAADPQAAAFPVPEAVCRRVRAQKEQALQTLVQVLEMPVAVRRWLEETELV